MSNRFTRSFAVLAALSAVVFSAVGAAPAWRCEDGRPCPLTVGAGPWHHLREVEPVIENAARACCAAKRASREATVSATPMRCVLVADGQVTFVEGRAAIAAAGDFDLTLAMPPEAVATPFDPCRGWQVEWRTSSPGAQTVEVGRGPRAPPSGWFLS